MGGEKSCQRAVAAAHARLPDSAGSRRQQAARSRGKPGHRRQTRSSTSASRNCKKALRGRRTDDAVNVPAIGHI